MTLLRRIFTATTLVALSSVAQAESVGDMLPGCQSIHGTGDQVLVPPGSDRCWGAFGAIQDLIVLQEGRKPLLGVCAPPNSRRTQLIAIFLKAADPKPERWHEDFGHFALLALRAAFPCRTM